MRRAANGRRAIAFEQPDKVWFMAESMGVPGQRPLWYRYLVQLLLPGSLAKVTGCTSCKNWCMREPSLAMQFQQDQP